MKTACHNVTIQNNQGLNLRSAGGADCHRGHGGNSRSAAGHLTASLCPALSTA